MSTVERVYADSNNKDFVYAAQAGRDSAAKTGKVDTITETCSTASLGTIRRIGTTTKNHTFASQGDNIHSTTTLGNIEQCCQTIHKIDVHRSLNWLGLLPTPYQALLDYFLGAIASFSCHVSVRNEFCSTLIPMALNTSPLLAAVLHLAAVHRKAAGLQQDTAQLAILQGTAVAQLRQSFTAPRTSLSRNAIVATSLTLCVGELASGLENNSWRVHLSGTAAIYDQRNHGEQINTKHDCLQNVPSPAWTFTFRWFASLVVLGSLSGKSPSSFVPALKMVSKQVPRNSSIDLFTGFSPNLLVIFAKIGLLIASRSQMEGEPGITSIRQQTEEEAATCVHLIEDIRAGLDVIPTLSSSTHPIPTSTRLTTDFVNLNKAYHNAALLHLYRRVIRLPSKSTVVQSVVQDILTQVASLEMLREPCPAIAQLFPLFTAGCEVSDEADRLNVTKLLQSMQQFYNLMNVQQAIIFLHQFWAFREQHDQSVDVHWDEFSSKRRHFL